LWLKHFLVAVEHNLEVLSLTAWGMGICQLQWGWEGWLEKGSLGGRVVGQSIEFAPLQMPFGAGWVLHQGVCLQGFSGTLEQKPGLRIHRVAEHEQELFGEQLLGLESLVWCMWGLLACQACRISSFSRQQRRGKG
jgi:hypothetical protein